LSIIHIGEGRHIELDEGAIFRPPPVVKKYVQPRRVLSEPVKKKPPKPEKCGDNHHIKRIIDRVQGYKEFWAYKQEVMAKYRDGGRRIGEGPGLRRKKVGYLNGWAKRRAKKDMENIKRARPDLDDVSSEALEGALTVLRGPQSQSMKLQAAKLLLDFSMSKPVAKSEVSVNAAEDWLASLAKDDSDSD
jgi:hypothetical protein